MSKQLRIVASTCVAISANAIMHFQYMCWIGQNAIAL